MEYLEPMSEEQHVSGRIAAILRTVARFNAVGARAIEITRATAIPGSSVHRLLSELMAEGLILQKADRRYTLAPALYSLGLSAPGPFSDTAAVSRIVQELAYVCGDTVYLAMRVFGGAKYLMRHRGQYPIHAYVVEPGETLPFATTFASTALLASLNDETIRTLLRSPQPDVSVGWTRDTSSQARVAAALEAVQSIRTQGWWGSKGLLSGVAGMVASVPTGVDAIQLALSISSIESRLPSQRQAELLPFLMDAANAIGRYVANPSQHDGS